MESFSMAGTRGNWEEYDFDSVVEEITQAGGKPDLQALEKEAKKASECFEDGQATLLSLLSPVVEERDRDRFLHDVFEKMSKVKCLSYRACVDAFMPKGQYMSRDNVAIQAGLQSPPHIAVLARILAILHPYQMCDELAKLARRTALHIKNAEDRAVSQSRVGTKVFIGHGRSPVWRDLKDFIQDRLHLPWDEFNRIPVAGVPNIGRLCQMMDEAAIAFLIMTAEDEQADGNVHARVNVIHEAGLFQGRLGFNRAIVLREEGCEEFSNIHGLGQIPFPKGNIGAVFEEVRRVLERESIIDSSPTMVPGTGTGAVPHSNPR